MALKGLIAPPFFFYSQAQPIRNCPFDSLGRLFRAYIRTRHFICAIKNGGMSVGHRGWLMYTTQGEGIQQPTKQKDFLELEKRNRQLLMDGDYRGRDSCERVSRDSRAGLLLFRPLIYIRLVSNPFSRVWQLVKFKIDTTVLFDSRSRHPPFSPL
jgi:hypothetical protein